MNKLCSIMVLSCLILAGCNNFKNDACSHGEQLFVAPAQQALSLLNATTPKGQAPSADTCAKLNDLLKNFTSYYKEAGDYILHHYAKLVCTDWSTESSGGRSSNCTSENGSFNCSGDDGSSEVVTCQPGDFDHGSYVGCSAGGTGSAADSRDCSIDGNGNTVCSTPSYSVEVCNKQETQVTDQHGYDLSLPIDYALYNAATNLVVCPAEGSPGYSQQDLSSFTEGLRDALAQVAPTFEAFKAGECGK